jgi:hypothetical protein
VPSRSKKTALNSRCDDITMHSGARGHAKQL